MLLIGDIHCTSKRVDRIISQIQAYIAMHKNESTVVFLGDFVYHFSYDRKALLKVFSFFVSLSSQGKDVYVLAGNHDWISNEFVFAEGKAISDYFHGNQNSSGSIKFITEPSVMTIEGQEIFFFPYFAAESLTLDENTDRKFQGLLDSSNSKERRSGYANQYVHDTIINWKKSTSRSEKLLLIHHRYINNTQFPGQFARFSFSSPALSDELLDNEDIFLISGHLHQPFTFKNYLCCGSVWSTSPLEINQCKYLFCYDLATHTFSADSVHINPYYSIDWTGDQLTQVSIDEHIGAIIDNAENVLKQGSLGMQSSLATTKPMLSDCSISIVSENNAHQPLEDFANDELLGSVQSLVIKKRKVVMQQLIERLRDASLDLDVSISDWKTLLGRFLDVRFGDEKGDYVKVLEDLTIL